MADHVQVMTTVDSAEQAAALARGIVERRLAACAQIVGPIRSHYRWQGKVEEAEEWQHAQESERLTALIEARRKRLQQRWDLKYEMWRKDWEDQNSTQFDNVEWPLKVQYGGAICGIPESSEATTSIHAAAAAAA